MTYHLFHSVNSGYKGGEAVVGERGEIFIFIILTCISLDYYFIKHVSFCKIKTILCTFSKVKNYIQIGNSLWNIRRACSSIPPCCSGP